MQAFSSITLRGSNPDQVSIYVDGVPLNVAQGGGTAVDFTVPLHGIRLPASVLVQPGHRAVNVAAQIPARAAHHLLGG